MYIGGAKRVRVLTYPGLIHGGEDSISDQTSIVIEPGRRESRNAF